MKLNKLLMMMMVYVNLMNGDNDVTSDLTYQELMT